MDEARIPQVLQPRRSVAEHVRRNIGSCPRTAQRRDLFADSANSAANLKDFISRTDGASSNKFRTASIAELRNPLSPVSPVAAIAASFMESASEFHTAAYSCRRQLLSGGQSMVSCSARTEYPQTNDEKSKQMAAVNAQTAFK